MLKSKPDSIYSNEKIKNLLEERNRIDSEIENEIQKERAKYKFIWKRLILLVIICAAVPVMLEINEAIFTSTSIWSWQYWIK